MDSETIKEPVAVGDLITAEVDCPGPCSRCGIEVEHFKTILLDGKPMMLAWRMCAPCFAVREQEFAAAARARTVNDPWLEICPSPEYRATDIDDPRLNPECVRIARGWPLFSTEGIGLISTESGIGKTRCLFWLLRRVYDSGRSCAAITHRESARLAVAEARGEFDEPRKKLRRLRKVAVLLIDDVGKGAFTPRANEEFYDLIEYRTAHNLPILWTGNASGQWLIERLGEDYGEAVVRRLAESSQVITIE